MSWGIHRAQNAGVGILATPDAPVFRVIIHAVKYRYLFEQADQCPNPSRQPTRLRHVFERFVRHSVVPCVSLSLRNDVHIFRFT